MISTKNIITDLKDIPREWVFEYYLNLKEKLIGQDVKILSVFNSKDKVPSMFIYTDTSMLYKFKDFSSGLQGDHVSLVKHLFNYQTIHQTINRIITDYEQYLKYNKPPEKVNLQLHDKFKVVDYQIRHWNTLDVNYWTDYKINSKILELHNVYPLEYFIMEKQDVDGKIISYEFKKLFVYGYFRNDGSLYKIYMPKNLDKKFIKVENYTQGIDQLKYDSKYLIILSSLKDLMCFKLLGIQNIECIAPDSENTMIGESIISTLKQSYIKIIVLFDNDGPGEKAAQRYKDKYNIDSIKLDMSKDLSDSVKDFGIETVREKLFLLLKQAL
jgi:hypothetical protein